MCFPVGPKAHDAPALEADAASAGLALACVYSSSDEYEAEVIKARREAGAYGPRRQWRHALVALAVAVVSVVLLVLIFRL